MKMNPHFFMSLLNGIGLLFCFKIAVKELTHISNAETIILWLLVWNIVEKLADRNCEK